jgi:hypothetical protein
MLETLDSQLHFVRQIQQLEADLVAPLKSIRDESTVADSECEIGCEELKEALENDEVSRKNPRARQGSAGNSEAIRGAKIWDVLGHAERRVGRYFVVETRKK